MGLCLSSSFYLLEILKNRWRNINNSTNYEYYQFNGQYRNFLCILRCIYLLLCEGKHGAIYLLCCAFDVYTESLSSSEYVLQDSTLLAVESKNSSNKRRQKFKKFTKKKDPKLCAGEKSHRLRKDTENSYKKKPRRKPIESGNERNRVSEKCRRKPTSSSSSSSSYVKVKNAALKKEQKQSSNSIQKTLKRTVSQHSLAEFVDEKEKNPKQRKITNDQQKFDEKIMRAKAKCKNRSIKEKPSTKQTKSVANISRSPPPTTKTKTTKRIPVERGSCESLQTKPNDTKYNFD